MNRITWHLAAVLGPSRSPTNLTNSTSICLSSRTCSHRWPLTANKTLLDCSTTLMHLITLKRMTLREDLMIFKCLWYWQNWIEIMKLIMPHNCWYWNTQKYWVIRDLESLYQPQITHSHLFAMSDAAKRRFYFPPRGSGYLRADGDFRSPCRCFQHVAYLSPRPVITRTRLVHLYSTYSQEYY